MKIGLCQLFILFVEPNLILKLLIIVYLMLILATPWIWLHLLPKQFELTKLLLESQIVVLVCKSKDIHGSLSKLSERVDLLLIQQLLFLKHLQKLLYLLVSGRLANQAIMALCMLFAQHAILSLPVLLDEHAKLLEQFQELLSRLLHEVLRLVHLIPIIVIHCQLEQQFAGFQVVSIQEPRLTFLETRVFLWFNL